MNAKAKEHRAMQAQKQSAGNLAPRSMLPKVNVNLHEDIPKEEEHLLRYWIKPSLFDIARMTEEELHRVTDFQVGNEYGEVRFLGPVDLAGVDVDSTIRIRKR